MTGHTLPYRWTFTQLEGFRMWWNFREAMNRMVMDALVEACIDELEDIGRSSFVDGMGFVRMIGQGCLTRLSAQYTRSYARDEPERSVVYPVSALDLMYLVSEGELLE